MKRTHSVLYKDLIACGVVGNEYVNLINSSRHIIIVLLYLRKWKCHV